MDTLFDVIVVGGGPGGYVAAIRAAQLGLKTALVEKQHLGGICLNWGCIPTKALLHGAQVAHTLSTAEKYGFTASTIEFDLAKLVRHSRGVSERLAGGVAYLMKKNGITVIDGVGHLTGKGKLAVDNQGQASVYRANHIILATGARPRSLPGIEPDGERIWSYFHALVPEALPDSLLVIGSGAIGVEFASLYRDLGVDVTLVEIAANILPAEDCEVSAFVRRAFEQRGIDVHTSTRVESLVTSADSVSCTLAGETMQERKFDRVLLCAGVRGNIEQLGLDSVGVATESGFISTDAWGKTNVAGVYAIGDVAGAPCLAHKASHEAVVCIEKLAGVSDVHPLDKSRVPGCTYCRPQVASVGLTEAQARAQGVKIKVGKFDFQANGKALAIGEASGFVKTVFDSRSGELLGAHMVGPEVTEQIQGFGLAQAFEATENDLADTVFAHPTLSEAMHESVLDALGRSLHQ